MNETLKVDEKEFTCSLCLDIAADAVESECCHQIFCASCSAKCIRTFNKCPTCRKQPFLIKESILIQR